MLSISETYIFQAEFDFDLVFKLIFLGAEKTIFRKNNTIILYEVVIKIINQQTRHNFDSKEDYEFEII